MSRYGSSRDASPGIEDLRQRFVEDVFEVTLRGKPGDTGPDLCKGKTMRGYRFGMRTGIGRLCPVDITIIRGP
jgi:hypothetical protein